MTFNSDVWERRQRVAWTNSEISANVFNLIFALTTIYGMIIYGVLAAFCQTVQFNIWSLIGVLVVSFAGCFVTASKVPILNFLGLTMIAGGLGALSGPFIAQYKVASVVEIAAMTVLITVVLGAVGTLYPKSLENWGMLLFIFLIALIVAQILFPILYVMAGLPLKGLRTMLDWAGVILFSGYIVYDFNRAQFIQKTVDNAMDSGIAVFLDIANLFIRLLELFGSSKDDD